MLTFLSFVFIFCIALSPVQGAEEEVFALFAEETLVSTPSQYAQPIERSPSTVTVITEEDIRLSGATSIPELLRRVPGVEVMQTGSAEFNVSIRGNNQLLANKLLVLVDNRPVQEDGQNTVIWPAIPVLMEEIKQIEVVRGPGSATWGPNAFDGVINIITLPLREGTSLSMIGGQPGVLGGDVVHTGNEGAIGYRIGIGYRQEDTFSDHDQTAMQASRGDAVIQYTLAPESRLTFSAGSSHLPHYEGPQGENGQADSTMDTTYLMWNYQNPHSFLRGHWNHFGIEANLQLDTPDPVSGALLRELGFVSDQYNLEGQREFFRGQTHLIVGGGNLRFNQIQGVLIGGERHRTLVGFYLQDEWNRSEHFTLISGFRYDVSSLTHPEISPRVTLLYRLPTTQQTVRLSVATAYFPPTPLELFDSFAGNTNLVSERIVSYEAGYSARFRGLLKTDAHFFYNRLSDWIDVLDLASRNNTGNATIYGVEVGGEVLIHPSFSVFSNDTYQQVQDSQLSRPLEVPRHKINVGARGRFRRGVTTEMLVRYASKISSDSGLEPLPSLVISDLHLRRLVMGETVQLSLSVLNLFNDIHKEHRLGDEIGRRFFVKITARF